MSLGLAFNHNDSSRVVSALLARSVQTKEDPLRQSAISTSHGRISIHLLVLANTSGDFSSLFINKHED